jgi:hypothetical protein
MRVIEKPKDESHPEVQRRLKTIVRLGNAVLDASENEGISYRVRMTRMRLLYKDAENELRELRAFCMETGDWDDEEQYIRIMQP